MLTWTDSWTKTQRLAKDSNPDTLIQLKQDMNTGYHLFNQKLARYFTRKQEFCDLKAGQDIYQTPVDCVRIMGMTVTVSSANYEPTVKEIRSEYQWRQMKSYKTFSSNWPTNYYMLGSSAFQLYPTPSDNSTKGLRFYYQPQDHDLSIDDVTSTSLNTTVTVTNDSPTVTATSGVFTSQMVGLSFQITGVTDLTWYEIAAVPNPTTLTLKSNFIGLTGSAQSFRIGQTWIIPQEYNDAPMHYALGNFFAANGNPVRSQFHLGTIDKPGIYYQMVSSCLADYSSSNESNIIDDSDMYVNPWLVPPVPGASF